MLECDRIDISEGIDINKRNAPKECDICRYWYFLDKGFKYEPYICNGCHDLMQKAMNFNNLAIVSVNPIWLGFFMDVKWLGRGGVKITPP